MVNIIKAQRLQRAIVRRRASKRRGLAVMAVLWELVTVTILDVEELREWVGRESTAWRLVVFV